MLAAKITSVPTTR